MCSLSWQSLSKCDSSSFLVTCSEHWLGQETVAQGQVLVCDSRSNNSPDHAQPLSSFSQLILSDLICLSVLRSKKCFPSCLQFGHWELCFLCSSRQALQKTFPQQSRWCGLHAGSRHMRHIISSGKTCKNLYV